MSTVRANAVRSRRSRLGFTLIELLVVIAIIALLAAIIFPVFAKVQEKARQATVISNLHQIQTGLGQYQLDYHQYPPVLFGYAVAGMKMSDSGGATGGLYPRYVNDYRVFLDPNNLKNDLSATQAPPVKVLCPNADTACKGQPAGTLTPATPATHTFFTADAYDISPQITGINTLSTTFITRYQLSWTDLSATAATASGANYTRQMRWKTQTGDTYVTCSTYHVPNAGKVIVLYESGPAKVIDTSTFLAADPTDSASTFWTIRP